MWSAKIVIIDTCMCVCSCMCVHVYFAPFNVRLYEHIQSRRVRVDVYASILCVECIETRKNKKAIKNKRIHERNAKERARDTRKWHSVGETFDTTLNIIDIYAFNRWKAQTSIEKQRMNGKNKVKNCGKESEFFFLIFHFIIIIVSRNMNIINAWRA